MTTLQLSPSNDVSSHPESNGDHRTVLPERREAGTPVPVPPQRSVSVDEMLTQLRTPEGGKRRRRSEQPIYSKRRKRRMVISIAGGVAVLLVGGWYGFKFAQRLRMEGEPFRQGVERRISAALNCRVEFKRIHHGGESSLAAKEAAFTTRGQDLIAGGKFQELSADLTSSSWFSNDWGIHTLSIGSGVISLDPTRPPVPATMASIAPATAVREKSGGFRWSISSEPGTISLDAVRFTSGLDIEWPVPGGKKPEAIRKLLGGPNFAGTGMEGTFVSGVTELKGLPAFRLEHLGWKLDGRRFEIKSGRLSTGPGCLVEITGHADLVSEGAVSLRVSFVDTQLKTILPPEWHERVSGSLNTTDSAFQAAFGKGPERTLSGDFKITGALFNGMGWLGKVAHFLQRQDIAFLEFPELRGHFEWSPSTGLVLTNLSAERESFLRLAGSATVTPGGEIKGRLKVSASELSLRSRNTSVPHPFRPAEEGWLATEFSISGTSASVNDDIPVERQSYTVPVPQLEPPRPKPGAAPGSKSDRELEADFNELLPK